MKRIFSLIFLLAVLLTHKADAQVIVFGGGVPVLGTSNLVAGTNIFANMPVLRVSPYTVTFTNTVSVVTNNIVVSFDKTNWVVIGTAVIWGTNGLSQQTNFAGYNTNVNLFVGLQAITGPGATNTVTIGATYGPGQ